MSRGAAATGAVMLAALLFMVLTAPAARAGEWMQVSCVNPNGSPAGFQGWADSSTDNPPLASVADAACAPGSPMVANLSAAQAVAGDANEILTYTPPPGSTLVGGRMEVTLYGGGSGTGAVLQCEPSQISASGSPGGSASQPSPGLQYWPTAAQAESVAQETADRVLPLVPRGVGVDSTRQRPATSRSASVACWPARLK